MTKKIYYNYGISETNDNGLEPFPDDFFSGELRKASSEINEIYEHSKCPSVLEWYKNTWIVEMPFDLEINYDLSQKKVEVIKPERTKEIFNSEFLKVHESYLKNDGILELQLIYFYLFWTNQKDIWVEISHHPALCRLGIELIPGTFPVSSWTRPLNFAFKISNTENKRIYIPKNMPIYYIKFYSKYGGMNINFSLEKRYPSEDVLKRWNKEGLIKYFNSRDSWNFLKNRELNANKCPFSFFNK